MTSAALSPPVVGSAPDLEKAADTVGSRGMPSDTPRIGPALRVTPLATAAGRAVLRRLVGRGARVLDPKVTREAARWVRAVRRRGDAALLEASLELDGLVVPAASALRYAAGERAALGDSELPAGFAVAIEKAIAAVTAFHTGQVALGYRTERDGVFLEERRTPLSRVGLYVPGGRAVYPSTLVMTAVPAQLAGVREIVVATPPRALESPALRHTLARLGITEVWSIGGAAAIAAFAYGTESIRRVDKVLGPGNAWVAAAKRLVAGDVAVDGVAGPSEVVVVASEDADPEWIAGDLLAQAEHDPRAAAVLLTPSRVLAQAVARQIERQLRGLPTASTAREALRRFGAALVTIDLEAALAAVETLAPEHLQLVGRAAETLARRVTHAGAIFIGASSPEVFGDYVAGPSHVLPTCGTARFASALGVEDFIRRSHTVRFTPAAAAAWAGDAAALADAEGLPAHAAAARMRQRAADGPAGGGARAGTPVHDGGAKRARPSSPSSWVRPEIRALRAYSLDLEPCRHKLDQNETPWDFPRRLKEATTRRLSARDWSRYPDFHADALRRALGALYDWPWEGVLIGNGSNELLATAVAALGGPGRALLGVAPSFALYPVFALAPGSPWHEIPPRRDLTLQLDELGAEIARDPNRPVVLCSPNNPTGAAASPAEIDTLLRAMQAPLLLDNAYGEFCRHDYRPLLHRHRHLMLFRTFSKAWALAGVRLGYLLADPELVAELIKVKLPYNLGHAGIAAGEVALAAAGAGARRTGVIRARRSQWAEMLAAAGLEVFPSEANFLLVRVAGGERAAHRLRAGLAARGIRVRDVGGYAGLAGCLRISVGAGPALRAVRRALLEIAESPS